jgi:hypothetical protein
MLTVNKAQAWVNKTLLTDWSAHDLENSKILFPVSRNIAARWIIEAGFKYEQHKKSYYVDWHEDTDVLANGNKYIAEFFKEEIFEHCWMEELTRVNEMRRNQKHGDEEAAIYLLGSADKKDLVLSLFVRYLEYGKGKDGYWSYNHMVLQLEDCTATFKVLFPSFNIIYKLDHLSGHDKEKEDGLMTTLSMLARNTEASNAVCVLWN